MEKIKEILQSEKLQVAPHVKQNLTTAFRAKYQSPLVLTLNRSIPLWQVAASLLLLIGVLAWFRPFERTTIVAADDIQKVDKQIVTITDTVFVEKVIEKPIIKYIEVPSTTKIIIEENVPMAENNTDQEIFKQVSYHQQIDLEPIVDNYYDTAMVEHINQQVRGQSLNDSDIPRFEVMTNGTRLTAHD